MRREGALWVERLKRLERRDIDELVRIQTVLMEVLWASCVPQTESKVLQQNEQIVNMELKDLSDVLKSAIGRAQAPHFSIVFCGMVKAGCVV
jgi:hypothetical protein